MQFCTTGFLVEVAQYIKFGELISTEPAPFDPDTGLTAPQSPKLEFRLPGQMAFGDEDQYSKDEQDSFVITMSEQFADWVAAFLRRVILLFENLPEEGADGNAGGQTEGENSLLSTAQFGSQPIKYPWWTLYAVHLARFVFIYPSRSTTWC